MQDVITALQEGSKNLHGSCGCLLLFSGTWLNENKVEKSACFVLVFCFCLFVFLLFCLFNYLNPSLHYLPEIAVLDPAGNDCSIILP